ncbi:beta-galactosidase trimerization domain-containing protein [Parapedobacter pyrenivorans]|uniref:beta-galactosidase trimerization domain-containing protein n=1 Tax=Parapedobacter pyrenivorans TaxID=1305674 RepID=UPI0033413755
MIHKSLLIALSMVFVWSPDSYAQSAPQPDDVHQFFLTLQKRDSSNNTHVHNETYNASEMAIIVVDLWDKHWCSSFTDRSASLIANLNTSLEAARDLGIRIIFAPSETMDSYIQYPQRQAIKNLPKVKPAGVNVFAPPALPWGRTGGCECGADRPCDERKVWSKQHDDLIIKTNDLISDNVDEIHTFCKENGIKTLLYAGQASNMCVTWTRSFSVLPMIRYGYECLVIRDLTVAISGNGFDPDRGVLDPNMTPEHGSQRTLEHIEKYICPTISGNQLLIASGREAAIRKQRVPIKRVFDAEYVKNYISKGPTESFRQLCYDYNWVGRDLSSLPLKFTKSEPAEYAELSKQANMDAVLVLAVPHHGYTTHVSDYGEMFPGLDRDWFGEVVEELHKRDIHAFGYITLGANWKFMRDYVGTPQIRSGMEGQGQFGARGLCLNAPGYLDLVSNYSRELLTHYPIDGIRYDFMVTPYGCDCDGCKAYYQEVYHEPFSSWEEIRSSEDSSRYLTFNIETLKKAAHRLNDACRAVKPDVEVWQNHLDPAMEADLNTGRLFDVAYVEYGTPFRLLALRGILNKQAIIVGQTLKSPIRRLIMALGGRCYQYINVDQETVLPVGDELDWVKNDLSPFFSMVSEVQPYLENADPVSDVGILFSENTRYRFPHFDRKPYMDVCEAITNDYLDASMPLQYINVLDLGKRDLSQLRTLILPYTSGLLPAELATIRHYIENGGQLVVMGDALMYDEQGKRRGNFALAKEMGVDFVDVVAVNDSMQVPLSQAGTDVITDLTLVQPVAGKTIDWIYHREKKIPFVHLNIVGKGKVMYIASAGAEKMLRQATDNYFGRLPIHVANNKQVVLTEQPDKSRWVLHLIDDGDYEIRIKKDFVPFSTIDSGFAGSDNLDADLEQDSDHWIIRVKDDSTDRLLVLK